ncbi:conserved hypothetical protein [Uncinocarpus reesii 1704]|uniref:Uncharacterized protein n=1 Tax=Uncinocarpus reesii (strain UAMH 1704) TaxID=336963 RepID=C4JJZ0_UNCRE|nr:uncharacterized protein UREG_01947 [Uncinocarpus reesii 1704]EEP77098.1 conserved hypothetical protein [Uncinocarpus reesii 1704]
MELSSALVFPPANAPRRQGKIDERFKDQYDKLVEIRNQLDRLAMTQAWSLRETDLYMFQRKLNHIDECRVNGNFLDSSGQPADLHAQRLQTLRKCLMEVKESGGVSNTRELYPYSMKLNSIDNMRVDGKFYIGSDLPEGQGSVNELLAQCYDLCYELRAAADEGSPTKQDDL